MIESGDDQIKWWSDQVMIVSCDIYVEYAAIAGFQGIEYQTRKHYYLWYIPPCH